MLPASGNHRLPSDPAAMNCGLAPAGKSSIDPAVVIRPILPAPNSVNQRLPSGPAQMPTGSLLLVAMGNSVMTWARAVPATQRPARMIPERQPVA